MGEVVLDGGSVAVKWRMDSSEEGWKLSFFLGFEVVEVVVVEVVEVDDDVREEMLC